jgi:hypothetical protein
MLVIYLLLQYIFFLDYRFYDTLSGLKGKVTPKQAYVALRGPGG